MKLNLIYLLICFAMWARNCESSKILAIFPMPSRSHYLVVEPLLVRLAEKGHEVTVAGLYPQKKAVPNFKDIMLENNLYIMDDMMKKTAQRKIINRFTEMTDFAIMQQDIVRNTMEDSDFKELLKNPNGKFDMIIHDMLFPVAFNGLGEYFNVSLVACSPFGAFWLSDPCVGNISPASIIPHLVSDYDSRMSFLERLHTFVENMIDFVIFKIYNDIPQRQIYNEYFPNAKLSYDEAISDYSLLLANQHHSLGFPRPYVTNVVEIGGLNIPQNPGTLPKDMQEFLDDAPQGVIYFSMGSNIKGKDLPIPIRNIILNVFRALKQKVLWKFEDDTLPNKPENVFISPWCPQNAILNHPNVKVFITHGGLLSTTEAIYYGKPMLGIPMFADQPRNAAVNVKKGIALKLELSSLTEENFKQALEELLYNPKYRNTIEELSRRFHDKPLTAMENAEFWIEYVLRHNGAKFLQNASIYLNWFQFYSLDCIAAILIILFLLIVLIKILLRKCVNSLFKRNNVTKYTKKTN